MYCRKGSKLSPYQWFIGTLGVVAASIVAGCATPHITSLSVTPGNTSIALGETASFKVIANYNDGTTEDVTASTSWTSLNPGIATVAGSGIANSVTVGTAAIMASAKGRSALGFLHISKAALTSISLASPGSALALGQSVQLSAEGTYTDKSVEDISDQVSWGTANPSIAAVSSTGMVISKAIGSTAVTASLNSINGSGQITVSPAALASLAIQSKDAAVPLGDNEQFNAIGTYTDGSKMDLTSTATWSSSAPGIVSINVTGLGTAKAVGAASISAKIGGIAGMTTFSVSTAGLVSIEVMATRPSLPLGASEQLNAIATYTDKTTRDLTSSVTWSSSAPGVLGIRGAGLVAGISIGTAAVTAASGSTTGVTGLNVSAPALSSISLAPIRPTVPLGSSLQLEITGAYTDGSTQDVTHQVSWKIENPTIATINAGGIVSGIQAGPTGVEASLNGLQTSDTLIVQPLIGVAYFDATSGTDSTIRVTNTGATGQSLCAMVYVFDQDQQMSECCGCLISPDGLLTLSLKKNLLNNSLTGAITKSGTVMLVSSQQTSSGGCDASSVTASGTMVAWATHLAQSGVLSSAEAPFSSTPLDSTLESSLQSQCSFIEELGSGQGLCACGSSP